MLMLLVKGSIDPPKKRQTGQGVTWLQSRKTLESGSGSGVVLSLFLLPMDRSSLIPFLFTPVVSIQGWMEVGSTDPETAAIRSKNYMPQLQREPEVAWQTIATLLCNANRCSFVLMPLLGVGPFLGLVGGGATAIHIVTAIHAANAQEKPPRGTSHFGRTALSKGICWGGRGVVEPGQSWFLRIPLP